MPVRLPVCPRVENLTTQSRQKFRSGVFPGPPSNGFNSKIFAGTVLFCSLAVLDPTVAHTMDVLSPFVPVLCHSIYLFIILIDSTTERPVHVLMLSTQAVRGLPRLRAPGRNYHPPKMVRSWCAAADRCYEIK